MKYDSRHGARWMVWDYIVGWAAFCFGYSHSPYTTGFNWHYLLFAGGVYGFFLFVMSRVCNVPIRRRNSTAYEIIMLSLLAVVLGYVFFGLVVNFVLVRVYGRYIVAYTMGISWIGLVAPRLIFFAFMTPPQLRVILYGAGLTGRACCNRISADPSMKILGFLDDDPAKKGMLIGDYRVLGAIQEWVAGKQYEFADIVIICVEDNLKKRQCPRIVASAAGGM